MIKITDLFKKWPASKHQYNVGFQAVIAKQKRNHEMKPVVHELSWSEKKTELSLVS